MYKERLFRGLTTDGKWLYGYLIKHRALYYIQNTEGGNHPIIQSTIGQFTGLKDKKGNEIYDGDIVRYLLTDWSSKSDNDPRTLEQYLISLSKTGVISYDETGFTIKHQEYTTSMYVFNNTRPHGFIEIIGNIHEHPHLINSHHAHT